MSNWIFYSWRISNMNSSFTEYLSLLLRHFSDIVQTVENNHYGLVYFWNCIWKVKSSLFCLNTLFVTVFAILNTTSAPKYSLQSIHIFTHLSKIWPLLLWLVLLFLSYLSFPYLSFYFLILRFHFLNDLELFWHPRQFPVLGPFLGLQGNNESFAPLISLKKTLQSSLLLSSSSSSVS